MFKGGVSVKLAIIGSRSITDVRIADYIPEGVDEIVSGGAKGVDTLAKRYAIENFLKITEFLPQYELYGRAAPLRRNDQIAQYADEALVFWDGASVGTRYTVKAFDRLGKKVTLVKVEK